MYFTKTENRETLRLEFRKLALILHPDKQTGNAQKFIEMKAEYQNILNNMDCPKWDKNPNTDLESVKIFNFFIKEYKGYPFHLELVGNWLWCGVDITQEKGKELKEIIKQNGWRFSQNKTKWYYFKGIENWKPKRSRYKKSYFSIIKKYGVQKAEDGIYKIA